MKYLNKRGFTLIELLLVIVIIAILTGVVVSIINPARQRARANQAVAKGNVSKLCLAYYACINSEITGIAACDEIAELDVTAPTTPAGVTYTVDAVGVRSTVVDGCTFSCVVAGGAVISTGGATCYVD